MLCTAELNMAKLVKASDIDVFYQMQHGPFTLPTITVLKASPGAEIFGRYMLFNIPFIAAWKKFEEHKRNYVILTLHMKMKAGLIMITRLVKKYFYRMMVYYAKQNPGISTTPGQSRQSI
jgi:hypothetical protein